MFENAIEVIKLIEKKGFKAYIVGGYVRDIYLSITSKDIDICTNAKPKDLIKIFKRNIKHFFTKWKSYNKEINLKYALTQDKELDVKIKNENSLFNFNIKERYSGLHYNENEIFNTNYDKFISNQINYVKKNKIKNYISEIKSSFLDSNERKIKLKLESIKLIFSPKKEQNGYKQFYIFIPLSYVFLFYSYDFSFFQKMLMSLLKFETNYKSINFKNEGFIDLLNSLNNSQNKQKEDTEEDLQLVNDIYNKMLSK